MIIQMHEGKLWISPENCAEQAQINEIAKDLEFHKVKFDEQRQFIIEAIMIDIHQEEKPA